MTERLHRLADALWYEGHPLNWALRPVSAALGAVVKLRKAAYRRGYLAQYRSPVPVIVVGNISVGGTGKTPFIIWLGKLLQAQKNAAGQPIRIGVVSRGYQSAAERGGCQRVNADSLPEQVGDEPYMIYQHLQCPMAVAAKRTEAIATLLQDQELDVILSDDGMQHYAMARDLEIALIDGSRGLGNGQLLPAGPLREPPERLQSVDFIVANSAAYADAPIMQLQAQQVLAVADGSPQCPLAELRGQTVHAIAGIGNPQRFFTSLREQGIDCVAHPFADHHRFSAGDLQFNDDLPVLMTEKDAVKCRKLGVDRLWYVPVQARLPQHFSAQLLDAIQSLICPGKR